ncbi:MAG TPA: GGDEF domain-containing protein, partial [Gammaproteobacteria bacterium]
AKREVDAAHIKLDRAHRRLRDQSLRDALTGCLNRRAFAEGAGLELVEIGGAVVVADLDNLKEINDAYGHQAGDALLQYFAAVLRSELRASDSLYRWGGDELLLLLPEGHADSVQPRLAEHFRSIPACELPEKQKIALRVSIGAADFRNGGDFQQAIHAADRAMYRQKRAQETQQYPSRLNPFATTIFLTSCPPAMHVAANDRLP